MERVEEDLRNSALQAELSATCHSGAKQRCI